MPVGLFRKKQHLERSPTATPGIHLKGKWLREAGFETGPPPSPLRSPGIVLCSSPTARRSGHCGRNWAVKSDAGMMNKKQEGPRGILPALFF
ncbi:SymE family type I addiction module toxin [Vibrio gazogenes]|uniref:SymE family type I addiction module toxin n=1 Tax=Vibrio gazogenes TaxID=687 RepID=UPI003520F01C